MPCFDTHQQDAKIFEAWKLLLSRTLLNIFLI